MTCDDNAQFYTGLPNVATFKAYLTIFILCGFSSPKTGALRLGHSQPSDIFVSLFSKIFNT